MPTAPDNHDAYDYAERIRERLPRRLQELREAMGLSNVHPGSCQRGISRAFSACENYFRQMKRALVMFVS